jgi:hypothetical protein
MLRWQLLLGLCFIELLHSIAFAQTACQQISKSFPATGFRFDSLPTNLQAEARSTLQDLLDHEGLYTLFSDLKPMSTGFWNTQYSEAEGEPESVHNMKLILNQFAIEGRITAGVLTFARSYEGTRYVEGFIANIPALQKLIQRQQDFFQPLGIHVHSSAQEIIEKIDRADPATRFRGFGLLFGYPQHAINFFVAAHQQQQETGKFVERDFFHVETFRKDKGAFVWAVPKGHLPNSEDLSVQYQAHKILDRYRQLRLIWTNQSLPPESLVQYWFSATQTVELAASHTNSRTPCPLRHVLKSKFKFRERLRHFGPKSA